MRLDEIKIPDWRNFASDLFGGKVNYVSKVSDECHDTIIVNITTKWDCGDRTIELTDDVYFNVPFASVDGSIITDWTLADGDLAAYYRFLLEHDVNPLEVVVDGD